MSGCVSVDKHQENVETEGKKQTKYIDVFLLIYDFVFMCVYVWVNLVLNMTLRLCV